MIIFLFEKHLIDENKNGSRIYRNVLSLKTILIDEYYYLSCSKSFERIVFVSLNNSCFTNRTKLVLETSILLITRFKAFFPIF